MLRFSIRDLIWLTAVVALACGWILSAGRGREWEAKYKNAAASLQEVVPNFTKMKAWIVENNARQNMKEQFINAADGPSRTQLRSF